MFWLDSINRVMYTSDKEFKWTESLLSKWAHGCYRHSGSDSGKDVTTFNSN